MPLNGAVSTATEEQLSEIEDLFNDASWETMEDFMTWVTDVVLDGTLIESQTDATFATFEDLKILSESQAAQLINAMTDRAAEDDDEEDLDFEDEDDSDEDDSDEDDEDEEEDEDDEDE